MSARKVLVVDDEPIICRSLSFALRKDRYEVFEARDGEQALEVIRKERPDLVFLDVMMPKMTGFDVAEQVRQDESLAGMKIILLTAAGQEQDRNRGESIADEYLTKPFSPTNILALTRKLLGE
ncbi:MAG: response regulator [Planctomycetota bacterium]